MSTPERSMTFGESDQNTNDGIHDTEILFSPSFICGRYSIRLNNGCDIDYHVVANNNANANCYCNTEPDSSCLSLSVSRCSDAIVYLNCTDNITNVNWKYSIGPLTNIPVGSSTGTSSSNIKKTFEIFEGAG